MFRIKRILLVSLFLSVISLNVLLGQKIAVKNNLFYDATATPNLALEIALGKKTTLEMGAGYNPFTFSDNKKVKHWLVQPELRLWTCEVFNGHFIGIHGHAAQYNVGGLDLPVGRLEAIKDNRYQGYLYGGGISYGYQWLLSPRWNFEFNLGGGYARIHYEKFPCTTCGTILDEGDYDYWGVTKAAISLIYIIK
ncbi:MAG: DUF3575 domain-containing protein [Dysgonamonadaceae bacterium]